MHRDDALVLLKADDFFHEEYSFMNQVHGEYFASQVAAAPEPDATDYDIELFEHQNYHIFKVRRRAK